jgi:hypothetical protein
MNFAESPSRIIYDYLMVSQTYTNSTFQALFLTDMIRHLVATAAFKEAARLRFLGSAASPQSRSIESKIVHSSAQRPAPPTSLRAETTILNSRFSQIFRQRHSSVKPIIPEASASQRPSESAHECQVLLAEQLPPVCTTLRISVESPTSALHGGLSHPNYMPGRVRACAAQQVACILCHLDSSHLNNPEDNLGQSSSCNEGVECMMEQNAENHGFEVLAGAQHCAKVLSSQPGSMQRTMLACEGIAINFLFDHGMPSCRV